VVLALHFVDRTSQIFQRGNAFLNLVEVILVLHVIVGAIKVLDFHDLLLNFGKFMLPINVVDRPCEIFQGLHLFLNLVKMMVVVNVPSHRVVHLLQSVNLPVDLGKLMLTVDVVHRTRERLQVDQGRCQLGILVLPVDGEHGVLQRF